MSPSVLFLFVLHFLIFSSPSTFCFIFPLSSFFSPSHQVLHHLFSVPSSISHIIMTFFSSFRVPFFSSSCFYFHFLHTPHVFLIIIIFLFPSSIFHTYNLFFVPCSLSSFSSCLLISHIAPLLLIISISSSSSHLLHPFFSFSSSSYSSSHLLFLLFF